MFPKPRATLADRVAISEVTHEMRQPLAAILTNAQTSLRWLEGDAPNLEKVRLLLNRVVTSAYVANDILTGLRQDDAAPAARTILDLNALVETACAVVRHEVEARAISLALDLAGRVSPILGDRGQLQQAIVNLLVNAIQAIDQSGARVRRVTVRTSEQDDGMTCVSVLDTGPGIRSADLDRIFVGGFTTKTEGMGLGLALCRSVLLLHQGDIRASNLPEGGAAFVARLPAIADGPATPPR